MMQCPPTNLHLFATHSNESRQSECGLSPQYSSTSDIESSNDSTLISTHNIFPTVVSILADKLEKRIPPLSNLSIGRRDKTPEELIAISENIRRNSVAGLTFAVQSLSNHSTGVIFEVLCYYIENNFPNLFEPTLDFCKMSIIFEYEPEIIHDDKEYFATKEMEKIIKRMPSRRIALLSLLMRRFHIWIKEDVAFRLKFDKSKKSEELKEEAIDFLVETFVNILVRVSEKHKLTILEEGLKCEDVRIFLNANIHGLEKYEIEFERHEAESQIPLNPKNFYNATDYMRAKQRQELKAKIFSTFRLARENAKQDGKRVVSNPRDRKLEQMNPPRPITSPDPIAETKRELCFKPKACHLTGIDVYNEERQVDTFCLSKSLDWYCFRTLMAVISVDFWHKIALEVTKIRPQKEKMRLSVNGSWRRVTSAQRN